MEYIQKDFKLLFDLYDVNKDNYISRENFVLILESLGLSEEFSSISLEEELSKISYGMYLNIMENSARKINSRNKKILFDEYSDGKGFLSKNNLKMMLENHLDNMAENDLNNLIDNYMKGEDKINFEKFKRINIF